MFNLPRLRDILRNAYYDMITMCSIPYTVVNTGSIGRDSIYKVNALVKSTKSDVYDRRYRWHHSVKLNYAGILVLKRKF